ncbi:NrfD/PsrC family molybdoenzyme membrane anchor subunit [candidate division KSB1 bacterium]
MKLKIVKSILWFILGTGTIVGIARFIHGLGATTNLTDTTPWGLWIGFDVMGGVALAAGGFVIAGAVYILHLEKYKPILRAAVLTAFLGYLAVAVGLLFDLGLPWNIWHMIIFWNPHSPLFEVGWCVMLYLAVLFLEFAPVWLEKSPFKKLLRILKKATIPLVIFGIMLSTLHQSSLGSLLLVMPFRLHELWYSPFIPIIFFVSAVGLGLMMVTLESIISSWLYNKEAETDLLSGLGKAAAIVLGLYTLLKIGDLIFQGKLGLLASGSWESYLYIFELLISAVIPAVLLALPKVRTNKSGQLSCAVMVVLGFVLNRINASGIATVRATGSDYFPSLMEIAISMWVVSGAALIFLFFIENFRVWETEAKSKTSEKTVPSFDTITMIWNSETFFHGLKRYSLMFTAGAALAFSLLPRDAVHGPSPVAMPIERARIADNYIIDGNRMDMAVIFDHKKHQNENGCDSSCVLCHHMNKPLNKYNPCADCHKDMYSQTYIFKHDFHIKKLNGNEGCHKCHKNQNEPKTPENSTECTECHTKMRIKETIIKVSDNTRENYAPGYIDAMHGLCITCHKNKSIELNKPHHEECATCHKDLPDDVQAVLNKLYMKEVNN